MFMHRNLQMLTRYGTVHKLCRLKIEFFFSLLLKVSQSRNGFLVFRFPLKNERKPFDFLQKTIFVRFLEEIEDIKKPFRN